MKTETTLDCKVIGLFETPVIISRLSDAKARNTDLRQIIEQRRRDHAGINRSNLLGWHSDTHMLQWGGEPAAGLLRHLITLCDLQTIDTGVANGTGGRHVWSFEMWANVSPPKASNQMHAHPGAIWSAVYYVDDGYDGRSDRDLGGELVLYDPRFPMNSMYAPDFALRDSKNQQQMKEQVFRPAAGTMVVFPSWLMHAVRPYLGDRERISIAINLSLTPTAHLPEENG